MPENTPLDPEMEKWIKIRDLQVRHEAIKQARLESRTSLENKLAKKGDKRGLAILQDPGIINLSDQKEERLLGFFKLELKMDEELLGIERQLKRLGVSPDVSIPEKIKSKISHDDQRQAQGLTEPLLPQNFNLKNIIENIEAQFSDLKKNQTSQQAPLLEQLIERRKQTEANFPQSEKKVDENTNNENKPDPNKPEEGGNKMR